MVNLGIFQRLPAEIRVHIWASYLMFMRFEKFAKFVDVLTDNKDITVASDELLTFRLDQLQEQYYTQAFQPSITRVCRRIRSEALERYYETSNFVLHTAEGQKANDALRWLQCNRDYLSLLRRVSFWIRHVPSGAISISLDRSRRGNPWTVDTNWKWITVRPKPASAEITAKFLLEMLSKYELIAEVSKEITVPEDYFALMDKTIYATGWYKTGARIRLGGKKIGITANVHMGAQSTNSGAKAFAWRSTVPTMYNGDAYIQGPCALGHVVGHWDVMQGSKGHGFARSLDSSERDARDVLWGCSQLRGVIFDSSMCIGGSNKNV